MPVTSPIKDYSEALNVEFVILHESSASQSAQFFREKENRSVEIPEGTLVVSPTGSLEGVQEHSATESTQKGEEAFQITLTLEINTSYPPPGNTEASYRVAGEPFQMTNTGEEVLLEHDLWSLSGGGETLLEAEVDLIGRAGILAAAYVFGPTDNMTVDAADLRDFILKVM